MKIADFAGVRLIATHIRPHLDEICAIWLFKRFGSKVWPEAAGTEVVFWPNGQSPDGYEVMELASQGILLLSDEHVLNAPDRKNGGGCCALVAQVLGLDKDPALKRILAFVANSDNKDNSHPFDLAALANNMHQQFPEDPLLVLNWVFVGLDVKYAEQLRLFSDAGPDYGQASKEEIPTPRGPVKLVVAQSDVDQFAKYARAQGAGLIIQQRTTGHVSIFRDAKNGILFDDVVQMIRLEEQEAKGQVITTNWQELESTGTVPGAPEWFFQQENQLIINSSEGLATRLSLERIIELVKIGLDLHSFPSDRQQDCLAGECTSRMQSPCPYWRYGLRRCRKIRFEMKKK